MASVPVPDNSEAPLVIGRRSARLSTIIPLTIRGTDVNGLSFKENTWTISVNKHGAKIATFHQLALGALISLENPVLGRIAKARVIRVGEKRFPEDPFEVGVELTEAQNVWGVKFPPEDWQKGPAYPTGPRLQEKIARPTPNEAATKSVTPAEIKAPEAIKPVAIANSAAKPNNAHAEKYNQFNLAVAGLSQFAKQAEEPSGSRPQPSPLDLAPSAGQTDARVQASLQETTKRLEEQLASLAEQTRASRAQLEGLLAQIQETKKGWESESGNLQRTVREATESALESALAKLSQKAQQESESVASRSVDAARQRVQEEVSATLEAFKQEAGARLVSQSEAQLLKLIAQLEARDNQAVEEAKERINQLTQAAMVGFHGKLRKAVEELEPSFLPVREKSIEENAGKILGRLMQTFEEQAGAAAQKVELTFRENLLRIEEQAREEIAAASTTVRQSCQEEVDQASKELDEQLSKRVETASESIHQAGQEALGKLEATYQKTEASFGAQVEDSRNQLASMSNFTIETIQRSTETLLHGFQNELGNRQEALREKAVQETTKQLHKVADEALESSAKQLHKQAEDASDMLTEHLKTSGEDAIKEAQRQLAEVTRASLELPSREAQARAEAYRGQLQQTLLDIQQGSLGSLKESIRKAAELEREAFWQQLQKDIEGTGDQVMARIKTQYEQVAKEASDAVYKQVGVGAVVLKEWVDQASLRVETAFQRSLDTFHKQAAELSSNTLDKHRQNAETLLRDLHSRLYQAASLLQTNNTGATEMQPTEPSSVPNEKE